jgi:hypothetical protein
MREEGEVEPVQTGGSTPVLAQPPRRVAVVGLLAFLAIAVGGLSRAKWDPYLHKALMVAASRP